MQIRDIRQTSWFWVDKQVVKLGLGVYELAVYCLLCSMANNDGSCWPSINTISEIGNMSRSTVTKAIKSLIDKKLVTYEAGDHNKSNTYYLVSITAYPIPVSYTHLTLPTIYSV